MSEATFVIIDSTGEESVWEETSPHDPATVTVSPYGHAEIQSNKDEGPWTVSLTSHGNNPAQGGVIFDNNPAGTKACIFLSDGSAGIFNVQIPKGNSPTAKAGD